MGSLEKKSPAPVSDQKSFTHAVESIIANIEGSTPGPGVARFESPLTSLPVLDWLFCQPQGPRFYGSDREGRQVAALGAALIFADNKDGFTAAKKAQAFLAGCAAGIRVYGGMTFAPDADHNKEGGNFWIDYPLGYFFLPRMEVVQTEEDGYRLNVHLTASDNKTEVIDYLRQVVLPNDIIHRQPIPQPAQPNWGEVPNQVRWAEIIGQALAEIGADKGLQKVVPARLSKLRLRESPDPRHFISESEQTFSFGIEVVPGRFFVGNSPERLYAREERFIRTEALAGTRLAEKPDSDFRTKEHTEQDFVSRFIIETLEELCSSWSKEEVTEASYERLIHLKQTITGQLREGIDDLEILARLHPTPAVAGYPRAEAMDFLTQHEPIFRGWYGGPIGWMSRGRAEFSVAIRSAVINGVDIGLYAGAGIVPGSEAAAEWSELEAKIRKYKKLFVKD